MVLGCYLLVAYAIVPQFWDVYEWEHGTFNTDPRLTRTGDGHPGDPLNIAFVGSEDDLQQAMLAAGWYVADPLGLRSDLDIAVDTVLDRTFDDAPVSNLFLYGRREDIAFEQPLVENPRHRHHVRVWKKDSLSPDNRQLWIGSASFDKSVGVSHTTGQITHHIDEDVDAERDFLVQTLNRTAMLERSYQIPGFHAVLTGRNGGGDPWRTNGDLAVCIFAERSRDVLNNQPAGASENYR
jgi:hypothetical protein